MTVTVTGPRPWFIAKLQTSAAKTQINAGVAAKTQVAALSSTAPVITYTSGSAPTAGTTQTIADSTTPTVVELLQYIKNVQAQVNAIAAALKA